MHLDDFVDEFDSRHDNRRINHHTEAGVQPGGGHLGHLPPRNFQNIPQQFRHVQKLSKNKDEILYCNHLRSVV